MKGEPTAVHPLIVEVSGETQQEKKRKKNKKKEEKEKRCSPLNAIVFV
jgi:hypothetical protein